MWFCGNCGASLTQSCCHRCGTTTPPPSSPAPTTPPVPYPQQFDTDPGRGSQTATTNPISRLPFAAKIVIAAVAIAIIGTGGGYAIYQASRTTIPTPVATGTAPPPTKPVPVTPQTTAPAPPPKPTGTEMVKVNPWQPGAQIIDKKIDRNQSGCDGANNEGAGTATGINICNVNGFAMGLICWTDQESADKVVCWRPGYLEFFRMEKPPGFRGLPAAKAPIFREVELENGLRCSLAADGAGFTEDGEEMRWSCGEKHAEYLIDVDNSNPQWTAKLVTGPPHYAKKAKTLKVTKAFYAG